MADTHPPGRVVVADVRASAALNRRDALRDLMNRKAEVEVSNPHGGGMWRGTIIGIADHPVIHLELSANGKRVCLPQAYGFTELTGHEPAISDALLRRVQNVNRRLPAIADLTDRETRDFLGEVATELDLLEHMLAVESPQ